MKKKLIFIILFFVITIPLLAVFLPKNYNSSEIFIIKKGEGSKEISVNLEKKGLIWWGPAFRAFTLLSGAQGRLQSGGYKIEGAMNTPAMVKKFVLGDVVKDKITFPEGFDAKQIYQQLSGITEVGLADLEANEGYLFPDTYEIPYGIGSQEVIRIMTNNFDKKTAGLKITKEDIVMASIIEREVRTKEDKELVSGILWKRLRVGMPLQVDAAPKTYEEKGLPAGPICNPGLESITAAVYPKTSQYWYFLSTPEGKTIFSRTLDEHNIAKAKYLK